MSPTFLYVKLGVFLASVAMSSSVGLSQTVDIPDDGFELLIREVLNKATGDITEQDMQSLEVLSIRPRDEIPIQSLIGLEAAVNLKFLDISQTTLSDITLPNTLINLEHFGIMSNSTTSLSFPDNFDSLTSLSIIENDLTAINWPTSHNNLESLFLHIENHTLANHTLPSGLRSLQISTNHLDTLSLPSNLSSLEDLLIEGTSLKELSLPPNLTSLRSFRTTGNSLATLELPEGLSNLLDLTITVTGPDASIVFPDTLSNLLNLEILTSGKNLRIPSSLSNLNTLKVSGTFLEELILSPGLTSLETLEINSEILIRINLPSDMNNLIRLDLNLGSLEHFASPPGLTDLAEFSISSSELETLSLHSDMGSLESLSIDARGLNSLELFPELHSLRDLFMLGASIDEILISGPLVAPLFIRLVDHKSKTFRLSENLVNVEAIQLFGDNIESLEVSENLNLLSIDVSGPKFRELKVEKVLPLIQNLKLSNLESPIFEVPQELENLVQFTILNSEVRSFTLPTGFTKLQWIIIEGCKLESLQLPSDLKSLVGLSLPRNDLIRLELPPGLSNLQIINLRLNNLKSLEMPPGLDSLFKLDLLASGIQELSFYNAANLDLIDISGFNKQEIETFEVDLGVRSIDLSQPGFVWITAYSPELPFVMEQSDDLSGTWEELYRSDSNEWGTRSVFPFPENLRKRFYRLRNIVGLNQLARRTTETFGLTLNKS